MEGAWTGCDASHCIDGVTTYNSAVYYDEAAHPYICHSLTGGATLVITVTGYNVNKIMVYNRLDHFYRDWLLDTDIEYSTDYQTLFSGTFDSIQSTYTFAFSARRLSTTDSVGSTTDSSYKRNLLDTAYGHDDDMYTKTVTFDNFTVPYRYHHHHHYYYYHYRHHH